MSFRSIVLLFVSVGMLSFFAGCASFREGNVPRSRPSSQIAVGQGKTISVQVYGAVILSGDIYRAHPKTLKNLRTLTIKAYEESGLFSYVKEGVGETDLKAEIMIVTSRAPNPLLGFITGLTFYVIPSNTKTEFTVKTTISDRDGKIVGTFEKSETVTRWRQLVLILAMPFNWPESVNREALYDLNRATIKEARGLGIL